MEKLTFPPGPKGLPYIGNVIPYMRDAVGFLTRTIHEYGDIVHYKVGPFHIFLINHPDYIKDVLVTHSRNFIKGGGTEWLKPILGEGLLTSEGEFHLRQRRLAQPAFHKQRVASYADIMTRHAERTRNRWRDGERVNMAEEMMGLTLTIVGEALFDTDVASEAKEIGEALTASMEWWRTSALPFPELVHKLPLPVNRRFKKARKRLNATIYGFIREHRAGRRDQGDLLSMLLLAQDTEGDGGGMTNKQVRDEAITIFLAGHETTANALTWTWYLLSQHPEVEARLYEEIDRILEGRLPTVDDMPKLQYAEMVISESMRLFPPAWGIGRRAINDYELGGYKIPAGSIVAMSQYVMHRDPRYYPEPDKFDPMRWTTEERAKRPKYAYFPFGGGNRICIGEQFAWMEAVLVLATLAQQWQARLIHGTRVATEPLVTLRPRNGMPMRLVKRSSQARPQRRSAA